MEKKLFTQNDSSLTQKHPKMLIKNSEFKSSTTKKYWCYICKRAFNKIYIENSAIECNVCHNTMCEEILNSYSNDTISPQNYIPFSNHPSENEPRIVQLNNPSPQLIDFVLGLIQRNYEDEEIEEILNYVLNEDTNKYGSPPAAKSEIEKLKKYKINKDLLQKFGGKNMCPVCKEEFAEDDKCMDLPCLHHFHEECLMPWLNQHDSCPICRYELKTDDEDYENMKKLKVNNRVFE